MPINQMTLTLAWGDLVHQRSIPSVHQQKTRNDWNIPENQIERLNNGCKTGGNPFNVRGIGHLSAPGH